MESRISCFHTSLDLTPYLKWHTHPRDPRQNRRGDLKIAPQLEMRPSSITPILVESREAPPNSKIFLTFHRLSLRSPAQVEGTQGYLPQLQKEPRVTCPNSRKTSRFPLQHVFRPDSPPMIQEQCRALPCNSNGDWTSLGPHKRLSELPVVTQEKPHTSRHSSRKTTRFLHHREMRPFFSCRA